MVALTDNCGGFGLGVTVIVGLVAAQECSLFQEQSEFVGAG